MKEGFHFPFSILHLYDRAIHDTALSRDAEHQAGGLGGNV